jgi:LPXTG-motif cell wall-anchored protein
VRVRDAASEDAATLANFADDAGSSFDRTLLDRVEAFLANLRQPPARLAARVAAYEKASEERSRKRSTNDPFARSAGEDGGGAGTVVLVVVALLLLALVAWVVRRRRRAARPAAGPMPVIPQRVFEHARAAERAELREDADRELLALATLLDEQPVPSREDAQDAYQRALDAYTAARRRMARDAPTVDLVGVLVLVDQARGDLARASALDAGRRVAPQRPLCAFHPLHGRSTRTVPWQRGLQVPACAVCAKAVRGGRTPDALRDGDAPYFERDTVWARTGFGAWADDLVERVSRGER